MARDQVGRMQEQSRGMMHSMHQKSPNSSQLLGLVTLITGAVITLVLGGLTLAGIAIILMLATPIFFLLSPVLLPTGIVVALATGGFLLASTVFLGFCSFVSWIYNYVRGQKPVGAYQIDVARHRIADSASHVTHKAQEATGYLQSKAQEVQSKAQEAAPGT